MVKHCHRCGLELTKHSDQKVIEFGGDNRVLCPICYDMTLAFCTPAYVPGISKTQYELLMYQAKGLEDEKTAFEKLKDAVRSLRERGLTIPEIAKEEGMTNRMVMEVLK